MNIYIIAPALPPKLDGIGDYTVQLAGQLAKSATIKILTAQDQCPTPIPGINIIPVFSVTDRGSLWQLLSHAQTGVPNWLLLQYNPFSYGRWGLNPYLPLVMRAIKRKCLHTHLALMVHEPFVPITSWKFAIMTTWQRWQLWMLGRTADVVFFSIEAWTRRFQDWFPGKPILHLPVGSNIPLVPMTRQEARARLGISDNTVVLGLFGTAHVSRQLGRVRSAAETVHREGRDVLVLYIGPHGEAVRRILENIRVQDEGFLVPQEVSRCFAAMDVYLAPFVDGVSTRRASFMTGLQHGIATVGTRGPSTDGVIREQNGRSCLLADVEVPDEFNKHVRRVASDAALRRSLGEEGQRLYQREFVWERIASQLMAGLAMIGG